MNKVAIVQARMTSTRLPGKVLMDLAGRPMLAQQLRRLRRMAHVDDIVIATTTLPSDDPVVDLCRKEDARWYRGDEHDVLSRYLGAAREAKADLVIRITADCPLIFPHESDLVASELASHQSAADYASNVIERTYPQGLDTEALYRDALERTARLATSKPGREHVTWFIHRERPDLFERRSVKDSENNSDLRWTVDTPEDLSVIRRIYESLGLGEESRPYREVLALVRARPDLSAGNAHVKQKDS
ncbi:MAG: glycosyltransferase family protein [Deltaproteobacteria bacterium]|nr:glycosyltransferase family protein [Deltaproteobacteria bacterium]